jgi:hypothetical protein
MCGKLYQPYPVLAEVLVNANLAENTLFETPANDNAKSRKAA